jgi:hypothetical protein
VPILLAVFALPVLGAAAYAAITQLSPGGAEFGAPPAGVVEASVDAEALAPPQRAPDASSAAAPSTIPDAGADAVVPSGAIAPAPDASSGRRRSADRALPPRAPVDTGRLEVAIASTTPTPYGEGPLTSIVGRIIPRLKQCYAPHESTAPPDGWFQEWTVKVRQDGSIEEVVLGGSDGPGGSGCARRVIERHPWPAHEESGVGWARFQLVWHVR